ncbi:MAG: hypothetical protein KF778_07305 [Rhodocyclaceae bacterium]|nr:hypothetical protein [Rhodocyclaceae bacterium]MBX3668197.1 hypothetical protein [Rhodocyclaceae bacterium]
MNQDFDISKLLQLRTLTSALADFFARQVRDYLASLTPLLQPRILLGEHVRYEKSAVKGQDTALQELSKLFASVAKSRELNLQSELKAPLDIFGATLEITPASYSYTPQGAAKPITITTPLCWILSYKDMGPARMRELIANHARSGDAELHPAVVHYLVLYMLANRRPGAAPLMDALRFPLSIQPAPEFGGLPLVRVTAPVGTIRPPDLVIHYSTQISGTTQFEEVINLPDIAKLADPLKEQLVVLVREQGGELAAQLG